MEDNHDLISIIIPVYNVEKYLDKCINSVISQTYKNLEIILVDDGSTDNSGKICDKYAKKDKRVKVFHKKNGGVSSARNYGIKESNGKYLTFVDSDDWIDLKLIFNLYNEIIKNNCDFVQCNFKLVVNNKVIDNTLNNLNITDIYDLKIGILNIFYKKEYKDLRCVCGKLFKKDIIQNNNIKFDNNIYLFEDGIFVYHYLNFSKKISFINNGIYFYNQLINSSSHRYNKDQLEQYKLIYNRLGNLSNNDKYLNYTLLEFLMTYISRSSKYYKNRKIFINELKKVMKDDMYICCINNLEGLKLKLKQKVTFILLKRKLYSLLYYVCLIKNIRR